MRCYFFRRLFVLAFFVLCGCKEEQVHKVVPTVGVIHVKSSSVPLEFEAAGKIYGSLDIQVRAQVSGILKERRFKEGEFVTKGQSLFLIDPQPYIASYQAAEGDLAQAESEKRKATRDLKRMKNLFAVGAVSKKERDDAISMFEQAAAHVKVAAARLNQAKINLEYTDVRAPITGFVREERQTIGNLISVGSESSLLTSMVQLDPVRVHFSISGEFWRKVIDMVKSGAASRPDIDCLDVQLILPNGNVYPEKGKIIFVDNMEDKDTATIGFKAEVANASNELTPGQFVRVKVVGASYQCPIVPNSCLLSSSSGNVVYVIDKDGVANVRAVKARLLGNNAVVLSGLADGEVVVSEGLIKVRAGEKVNAVFKDVKNNAEGEVNVR